MTNAEETFQLDPDSTWLDAVAAFEADAAPWLTAADAPQLMALRAIARKLDGETFQAALVSQFTLVHRALLARRPGNEEQPPKGSTTSSGTSMFDYFGGRWSADAFDGGADA